MRLLITADLHFNHRKSRPVAEQLIDRMNAHGGDGVLLIGDTATADGDYLEQCLSRFTLSGPKLFIAGNHELWTHGGDSYTLFAEQLSRRVEALGWHWLETAPFRINDKAIVGTIGWYDYSLADPTLGVPKRFYEHKISPGAAMRNDEFNLDPNAPDVSDLARTAIARWNDANFVKLARSDEAFVEECAARLRTNLQSVSDAAEVIAATHTLPFAEMTPPHHNASWAFAKAFLGSKKIGQVLQEFPNVKQVFCGHSHYPAEATIGSIHCINIGSGYGAKTFRKVEL